MTLNAVGRPMMSANSIARCRRASRHSRTPASQRVHCPNVEAGEIGDGGLRPDLTVKCVARLQRDRVSLSDFHDRRDVRVVAVLTSSLPNGFVMEHRAERGPAGIEDGLSHLRAGQSRYLRPRKLTASPSTLSGLAHGNGTHPSDRFAPRLTRQRGLRRAWSRLVANCLQTACTVALWRPSGLLHPLVRPIRSYPLGHLRLSRREAFWTSPQ